MATPKKKHLIELMIEEGIEWHKGAEYAAQDKDCQKVHFYKTKPLKGGDTYWSASGCIAYSGIQLPSLCRNWNQTIVTREQYSEAVAAVDGNVKLEQQPRSEADADTQPESIESLLSEIKAKREELAAKTEALTLEIASIEHQLNDKLKEYGFVMSQVAAQSEFEDKPWRIGDKCIVTDSPDDHEWVGRECLLTKIDRDDINLPYRVESEKDEADYWVREIRRP